MKAQAKFYRPVQENWYLSHMRAASNQVKLHICAVSPGPLQITLKRTDVDECLVKLYQLVKEGLVLNATSSESLKGKISR